MMCQGITNGKIDNAGGWLLFDKYFTGWKKSSTHNRSSCTQLYKSVDKKFCTLFFKLEVVLHQRPILCEFFHKNFVEKIREALRRLGLHAEKLLIIGLEACWLDMRPPHMYSVNFQYGGWEIFFILFFCSIATTYIRVSHSYEFLQKRYLLHTSTIGSIRLFCNTTLIIRQLMYGFQFSCGYKANVVTKMLSCPATQT